MAQTVTAVVQTLFKTIGVKATQKQIDQVNKSYKKLGSTSVTVGKGTQRLTTSFKKVRGELKATTKASNDFRQKFNFAWLSVMFGGMAIQKAFQGIFDKGFKTFRDLAGETNPLNRAMSRLTAETTLLKFTLGEALASTLNALLPVLIPIIEAITEWIEKNPKLAGGLVIAGLAIGTFLFNFGQLMLFVGGLKLLGVSMAGIKGASIAAAGGLKTFFVALFTGVGALAAAVTGVVLFIAWLAFLHEKLGSWKEVFKAFGRGIIIVWTAVTNFWLDRILDVVDAFISLGQIIDRVLGTNIAATGARAFNNIQRLKEAITGVTEAMLSGPLALEIGSISGTNPFAPGAFDAGSQGGGQTIIVNIDGATLTDIGSEGLADSVDEALRQTGNTQTG